MKVVCFMLVEEEGGVKHTQACATTEGIGKQGGEERCYIYAAKVPRSDPD